MRTDANDVIDRLHKVLNIKTDSELVKLLNGNKTTVSSWRTRNSVPYEICVQIAIDNKVSLDWLLTGEGEMYRDVVKEEMQLDPEERAVLRIMKKMDKTQKTIIRASAENIEQVIELKQQVSALAMR